MKDWFSKCGCNCGRCPAFKANAKTEKDRQRCSDGWHKYLGVRIRPDICVCHGCQSPDPWKSGAILPDRSCYVRPCAIKTGVETCAHCGWFPCEELKRRIPGEEFRETTERRIGAPVPEEDYVAFLEPYEGVRHLKEIRATLKEEHIAERPKVSPLKTRVTKFPDDLPELERETLRSLHGIFVNVLTAPAKTYAKQIIIKRQKKTLLNVLWVFARFGELKNRELVVDGSAHGRRDDLRNIVRRTTNTLHASATAAARMLKDYGVRFKHVPVKKDYVLKMSFDKSAGGVEGLKALQSYGTALIEKYGKPEYAGASRFKGEAYARFSKADMSVLKNY